MNANDIMSLIRKGPELVSQANAVKLNTRSIARGAKDSTFQFPCLISKTVPNNTANTTARTLDKVYATFAQTWISMNSMFDITIDPTPLAYLKRIHQNLSIESVEEVEDMDRYMEKVYDGSYRLYMNEDKSYGVFISEANASSLNKSNQELLKEYLSDFNLTPFESIYSENTVTEADESDFVNGMLNAARKNADDNARLNNARLSANTRAPRLTERDVKRSNDMLPYGIEVRLIALNDQKEFVQYIDVIIGIKTVLHPIDSDDMIDNIVRALNNKNLAFKFLRWTTGEISLIKDIILNINDIKSDATAVSRGKAPFFGTLKRLKGRKVGVSNLTVPHMLVPNSTIVITSEEADYIKDNFAIDLRDDRVALRLISSLFLMGFIIIDDPAGTMYALYDGDKSYQVFSLDVLERENNMIKTNLGKEVGRMISGLN